MNMNMMIWATAWNQYHQKNFGAARRALDLIDEDLEDDEFKEELELAKKLFDEEIEKR